MGALTLRKPVAGGIVLNPRGEVLLVKQRREGFFTWSLPKGTMKEGELPEETAVREIKEEAGVGGALLKRFLGVYERYKNGKEGEDTSEFKIIRMFLFRVEKKHLSPKDISILEARWCSLREAEDLLTHPKDRSFLINAREHIMAECHS